MALFRDRSEAGQVLAEQLGRVPFQETRPPIVLALPRGGVPVAFEIASALGLELDVFLVRKLGFPGEEELALGAIASGGIQMLNADLIEHLKVRKETVEKIIEREKRTLELRERDYREEQAPISVFGRTAILVDDGMATGASMSVAARAVRLQKPERIIAAVPVGSRPACLEVGSEVDDLICAATPHPFGSVGIWYRDFPQTSDEDVRRILNRLRARPENSGLPGSRAVKVAVSSR